MLPILQIAAKFRPTASAPAGQERPLANFIRTAITRASAGLCRRMVRHSGQGDMVSGEVGESRFGARRPPQRLRGSVGSRRVRGVNRKPCARTSAGARSGSTADPAGPVKSRSNRPGRNRLGHPDPVFILPMPIDIANKIFYRSLPVCLPSIMAGAEIIDRFSQTCHIRARNRSACCSVAGAKSFS